MSRPNRTPARRAASAALSRVNLIGTLTNVALAGADYQWGTAPGNDYSVCGVLITASPESVKPCLNQRPNRPDSPDPGATLLFAS